ncbi:MAG: hypothetical protein WBA33_14335 [Rhodanobacter lindaniclasticus]|jgi:hypothetical protein
MLKWLIDKLIESSGTILQVRKDHRELADKALNAVSRAINETYIYYRDVEAGDEIDKKRRDHLVHLWSQAAIPLRHIDLELAEICQYKSRYWLEPSNWRNEDVENFGIALEIVRDRYHALLQPRGLL